MEYRAGLAIALVGWAACVAPLTVSCPDGRICPAGLQCVSAPETSGLCVRPEQLADCLGQPELASCETDGRCYGGVCLPAGCGNGRLDPGEVCDDGNNTPGDRCSADCVSTESCGNGLVDSIGGETCDDGNLLGRDGCTSTCTPETPRWDPLAFVPRERFDHAMTYDIARERVVMFGGVTIGGGLAGETWELDGTGWVRAPASTSPSPRAGASLAYDAMRHRVVLFGGNARALLNDTWEWDGNTWTPIETTISPTPRVYPAMAYDAARRRLILFGGQDASMTPTPFGDTWTFDGVAWRVLATAHSPPARGAAAMAYDPVRDVIVLTGGDQTPDTWELDGTDWTRASTTAPPARAAIAYDAVAKEMIAFGGRAGPGSSSSITLRWDGHTWTPVGVVNPPAARQQAAMVSDPITGTVVLFGGTVGDQIVQAPVALGDTVRWGAGSWGTPTIPIAPTARIGHAGAYDPIRRREVVFGGNDTGPNLPETWELDGSGWSHLAVAGPSGRSYHAMAYDLEHRCVVLFGGFAGSALDDTWTWDGMTWTLVPTSIAPSPRFDHAMVYDSDRNRVVLFGGLVGATADGSTWEWDGATWREVGLAGPSPPARSAHTLAYDPIRKRVVLFGGTDNGTRMDDTWLWDGVAWTDAHPSVAPRGRARANLTWDPARQRLVLFGGLSALANEADTWEWDGSRWHVVIVVPPPARNGYVGFPDPGGAGILVFAGGGPSGRYDDVWRLRRDSTVPYEGCRDHSDLDGDSHAGCADPDCWSTCTPLCPPGVACVADAPHCGDGQCDQILETCHSCPEDCGACSVICGDFTCVAPETVVSCPGDCAP